ncbi:hypothetical protein H7H37_10240 [Mycolicibacterium insubricum]|nr:hypothetical protein [Mycolicibacterium insubricum]
MPGTVGYPGSRNADRRGAGGQVPSDQCLRDQPAGPRGGRTEQHRPQVDDLPDHPRLAHQGAHPGSAERREPGEGDRRIDVGVQQRRQHRGVLDGLAAALAQMRAHRVRASSTSRIWHSTLAISPANAAPRRVSLIPHST